MTPLRLPRAITRKLVSAIVAGETPAATAEVEGVCFAVVLTGDVLRIVGRIGQHPDAADLSLAPRYLLDAIYPDDADAIRAARRLRMIVMQPRVWREVANA